MKGFVTACALACGLVGGVQAGAAQAQAEPKPPKVDCGMFKRGADGRWMSTITSRVGNPKSFVTLQKGMPIDRDLTVVGLNISEAIDQSCGK